MGSGESKRLLRRKFTETLTFSETFGPERFFKERKKKRKD